MNPKEVSQVLVKRFKAELHEIRQETKWHLLSDDEKLLAFCITSIEFTELIQIVGAATNADPEVILTKAILHSNFKIQTFGFLNASLNSISLKNKWLDYVEKKFT